ncbi:MAG: nitrogen fixation protein FixH [Pseudomonadota bacterium]
MESTAPLPIVTAAGLPPRWWHFRMVWLVIAGPLAAVVVGTGTVVLAFLNVDPEVYDRPAQPPGAVHIVATTPAALASNHAATPRR